MSPDPGDRTDFDDATRGFIATLDPVRITDPSGRVVFDLTRYSFLTGEAPDTVDPSLWRQAQLCLTNGLFEVANGIYQVRGFDIANMTIVEGDTGIIVIDPLVSAECAAAAMDLYRTHRGARAVTGVIYTHCHVDHFGGVHGILPDDPTGIPILAPEGFLDHAVSENVYAGPAMNRRASYMYGNVVGAGPRGQVSTGLGIAVSEGSVGLVPPTLDITRTGQEEVLDGVRIAFQVTPGTEAPAEMNFLFPDRRALCLAENATHNLHNLLTLRGAQVRDPRLWARYLDDAIEMFSADTDVVFASHHWPTWGHDRIVRYLTQQRDMYAYLHDQTLRMLNSGATGIEIAENFVLPTELDDAWHVRGYYGSVSHNVKAIYQRYLGWFDGHPASLWQHPPAAAAARYAELVGGVDNLVTSARDFAARGDLRFAAELLRHAVFADAGHDEAKLALAEVFEQLGFGCENATWRGFYLSGAHELRHGITPPPINTSGGIATALSLEQLFDAIAIRIDGPRAATDAFVIRWTFTDSGTIVRSALSNGVLFQTYNPRTPIVADLAVELTKPSFIGLLTTGSAEGITTSGDATVLTRLVGLLETPDTAFPIVTP
ncbi:alkyl sulfatase dimerization domain-containing protein [Gordonia sp. ABSL1-1]|uniref:alkyl/aryl-sulfatase n=1 Tax=Gordonia sp. ABSL1-1 TaxID=3053923 RepID=UPI00257256C9|nr:alkyl sulfatase dimerization domain-containing protein [Gordonia sp. ABSL1-1]MDL9935962.1 alkyl sulfatase dimerization domain-containing protein [Gordonia sp. ABSL1-1]